MKTSEFLTTALTAVKKAEKIIMHYYSEDIRVTLKADQSPVTIADKEAEHIIKETIKKAFPTHGFLGEEEGKEHSDAEYIWIIDPIDGTKNYIRHIPIFGTEIALMQNGKLILGVSNTPALGELAYAQKGYGAFLNDKPIHVSNTKTVDKAFVCFGNMKFFVEKGFYNNMANLLKDCYHERGFGDIFTYHVIASGRADVGIEAGVQIWDIAATAAIIQEAGGMVTTLDGKPLDINAKSIVATNTLLHSGILKYFNK